MERKMNRNKRNSGGKRQDYAKVVGPNLNFAASEAYKLLRTNLDFSLPGKAGCKVIGVTSALRGEGKSTTAANMAYTIAQTQKKVLLLEADLRLPALAKTTHVRQSPGLSNLLTGQCTGMDVLQQSELMGNLWILTSGDVPPNPAELLASEQMEETLKALVECFDVIVIDMPPVTAVSDALLMTKLVNGMIVVVRQDYCDRKSLDETVQKLRFAETKILGFVVTDSFQNTKNYSRYSYKYGYYRKSEKKKGEKPNL